MQINNPGEKLGPLVFLPIVEFGEVPHLYSFENNYYIDCFGKAVNQFQLKIVFQWYLKILPRKTYYAAVCHCDLQSNDVLALNNAFCIQPLV